MVSDVRPIKLEPSPTAPAYLSFGEEIERLTPSSSGLVTTRSRRERDRGSALDEPELTGGIDRLPPGHEIAQR